MKIVRDGKEYELTSGRTGCSKYRVCDKLYEE